MLFGRNARRVSSIGEFLRRGLLSSLSFEDENDEGAWCEFWKPVRQYVPSPPAPLW